MPLKCSWSLALRFCFYARKWKLRPACTFRTKCRINIKEEINSFQAGLFSCQLQFFTGQLLLWKLDVISYYAESLINARGIIVTKYQVNIQSSSFKLTEISRIDAIIIFEKCYSLIDTKICIPNKYTIFQLDINWNFFNRCNHYFWKMLYLYEKPLIT